MQKVLHEIDQNVILSSHVACICYEISDYVSGAQTYDKPMILWSGSAARTL